MWRRAWRWSGPTIKRQAAFHHCSVYPGWGSGGGGNGGRQRGMLSEEVKRATFRWLLATVIGRWYWCLRPLFVFRFHRCCCPVGRIYYRVVCRRGSGGGWRRHRFVVRGRLEAVGRTMPVHLFIVLRTDGPFEVPPPIPPPPLPASPYDYTTTPMHEIECIFPIEHPRGSYIVSPLLSLEVPTPETKLTH